MEKKKNRAGLRRIRGAGGKGFGGTGGDHSSKYVAKLGLPEKVIFTQEAEVPLSSYLLEKHGRQMKKLTKSH